MTDSNHIIRVGICRLENARDILLPAYQTSGAAGLDLAAAVPGNESWILEPMTHIMVPTGLKIALPMGYEAQVRPRSGLALRHGLTILNSPGTIDCDYRGEISVILMNMGKDSFEITRGLRIAQMVIAPVARAELVEVPELSQTDRGAGGFGSTGTRKMDES